MLLLLLVLLLFREFDATFVQRCQIRIVSERCFAVRMIFGLYILNAALESRPLQYTNDCSVFYCDFVSPARQL